MLLVKIISENTITHKKCVIKGNIPFNTAIQALYTLNSLKRVNKIYRIVSLNYVV